MVTVSWPYSFTTCMIKLRNDCFDAICVSIKASTILKTVSLVTVLIETVNKLKSHSRPVSPC